MALAPRCLLLAVVLIGAACSSGDREGAAENVAEERPPPSTKPTASAGECLPRSSTVARRTRSGPDAVFLVETEVFRLDDCADQVVFQFRSDATDLPPGYTVEYRPGPFRDFTSADEIDVGGEAYLVVELAKTLLVEVADPGNDPDGEPTYTGRESIDPSGLNHLSEARIVQGPEGVTQWVLGLDSERPFTIDAASAPPRMTVTIG
jgi:hypothetical protein